MGRISALTELTSLASDDYLVVLDSSANIAKKISVANAFGIPDFGWTAAGESWTYASWTSDTRIGTITVPTDATTKYYPGMRIKITQSTGGTKYGIIHAVAATLLTVFFPVGTTLNNEAITSPNYSIAKTPLGFDADKSLWMLESIDTSLRSQTSPTVGTYYNLGSFSLAVGVGVWDVGYVLGIQQNSGTAVATMITALSNANNTAAYNDLRGSTEISLASSNINAYGGMVTAQSTKKFTTATTLYMNIAVYTGGTSATIYYRGDKAPVRIYAYSAYL